METIAVYWEPIIRTYGFNLLEKQVFCQVTLPLENLGVLGGTFQQLDDKQVGFRLAWAQAQGRHGMKFFLLCDDGHWQYLRPSWERALGSGVDLGLRSQTIVDIVFFHGPHFGDRYGILDYTFRALVPDQIPLLAVTCSVATIYLVVIAGRGGRLKEQLSKAFKIPTHTKSKVHSDSGAQ